MLRDGAWKKILDFVAAFNAVRETALSHYRRNVFSRQQNQNTEFEWFSVSIPDLCLFWFTSVCENFCSTSHARAPFCGVWWSVSKPQLSFNASQSHNLRCSARCSFIFPLLLSCVCLLPSSTIYIGVSQPHTRLSWCEQCLSDLLPLSLASLLIFDVIN